MRGISRRLALPVVGLGATALLLAACDTGDYTVRFVVGTDGLIINTTDAGSTWTPQASGVSVTLNGVAFAGTSNGCAVGDDATVVRTTDGSTWSGATTVPTTKELNAVDLSGNLIPEAPTNAAVSILPKYTAFAVGKSGTILYSADQCDTWTQQTSGTTKTLNGVSTGRCSCSAAWAVGDDGTILHTSNLGSTWSAQVSGVKSQLLAVSFATSNDGWAVGTGGVILATTNGGTTWTKQKSPTKRTLEGVAAADSTHAYAVGDDGVIVATSDGVTWTKQTTHTSTDLDSISTILDSPPAMFYSPANGDWHDAIAVGSGGLILMTQDGGATWTKSASGTKQNLEGAA
ncbi:MAG: hypothetical protein JOZ46_05370 [Candidatus Dormibacteraeota bacterium]|nr:hypothetical protein [Candidatus Dormibacteraeota bacterium]MBV9525227.1 hypothetical protein [Candidatus Dormibacteraeota bacterium]